MANVIGKYPENTPGKFYVDNSCIDCDLCRQTAPAFFKRQYGGGVSYSIVFQQPRTMAQEGICLDAMRACPVEAIGQDGITHGNPSTHTHRLAMA